jgi:hypothetical protein
MEALPVRAPLLHTYSLKNLEKYNSLRRKKEASTRAKKLSLGRNFPSQRER